MQCLHRTRQSFIEEKTAIYNRRRGLISEFGIIAPQSTDALRRIVSGQKHSLPLQVQQCINDFVEHVDRIEVKIAEYDRLLSRMAKADHRSQQLMGLKEVGPTTACALVERRGYWRAVVTIAAKNARLCWASLHYDDDSRLYAAS